MTDIPAQCERCGKWFSSSRMVGGIGRVTFVNSRVGPCPSCGGWGKIPDATYQLTDSIELIRTVGTDLQQLEKLRAVLEGAQRDRYAPKRLAEAIETEVPAFAGLKALLPQGRLEIQNYIMILLAALSLIISFRGSQSKDPLPTATQIFNTIVAQQPSQPNSKTATSGRNDPCHCGSGKKYKKCHGAAGGKGRNLP